MMKVPMNQNVLFTFFGRMTQAIIKRERPFVIGITGSVGKTSVKQLCAAVLDANDPSRHIRVTPKNYNNELGLPFTILNIDAPGRLPWKWAEAVWTALWYGLGLGKTGIKTALLEMGADKPGDLAHLVTMAPPDISIITGVTPGSSTMIPVHAAQYATPDDVAKEKSTLATCLPSGGTLILNADDPRVYEMRHMTRAHVMLYGRRAGCDVHLLETRVRVEEGTHGAIPLGLEVHVERFQKRETFFLQGVFGESYAYSACAAIALAEAMDVSGDLAERLRFFTPAPGRTRIIPGIKYTTLYDDSYNASPVAVLSAIRDLVKTELQPGQRRVACLGEMRELGAGAEQAHREIAAEVARLGIDLFVPCGIFAAAMKDAARSAGMPDERIHASDDTPEAGLFIQSWIKPGDVILAKASQGGHETKGVRMERVIKELMADPMRAGDLLCRQEERWKQV